MSIYDDFEAQLRERASSHLMRQRYTLESAQGAEVSVDGKNYLNFCSNDYLGHANHPRLKQALQASSSTYGVGGGASHLVCGHSQPHHELEEQFAALTGRESALLFSTGYMANLGILTALLDKQDAIFEDKWNHASLIDGGLMSGARFQRFLHNDLDNLEQRLSKTDARRKLVCVDGVFSMDGDLAPLAGLAEKTVAHDALLMVDDAHGFGVLGDNGLGSCELAGLGEKEVPILMCTLGKALGSFGAIVAGPKVVIDMLEQYARPYIYTTSMPPALAAVTSESLKLLQDESWRRQHVLSLVDNFKKEAASQGLSLMPSSTPIQPVVVGDEQTALAWQSILKDNHVWVSAIRPPTVPKGTARLRITFTAEHTEAHLEQLLSALKIANQKYPQGAQS